MPLLPARSRSNGDSDPFDLIRLVAALLLGGGTIIAIWLWATGISDKWLLLIGALWSIYGLIHAILDDLFDPLLNFGARVIMNTGLMPHKAGYSAIETLVARGEYQAAAVNYKVRADQGDAEAMARRAALLAGQLEDPTRAVIELERYRADHALAPRDDIRIGLALADLYERRTNDAGSAMRELRRLIDRYPTVRGMRRMRQSLAVLKAQQWPDKETT